MYLLTLLQVCIKHNIDHVFNVLEALGLKMIQNLSNELFFCPDEKHAFFHDIGWDHQLFEFFDTKTRESRSLVGEISPGLMLLLN